MSDSLHDAPGACSAASMPGDAAGFLEQKHLLLNVTESVRRQLPASWAGALRGFPALVCNAGASLEVSAGALARHADCGVIFAADTALRELARSGIVADFAVSVSCAHGADQCLAADFEPRRLVLSTVSPANWREVSTTERRYFLSRVHPTEDWLVEQGIPATPVRVAEDAGLTALDLARFLGCAPIHLFGFDFAPAIGDPASPSHPGNYTSALPVHEALWQACNARLAAWPGHLVSNINDRGVRLHGARLIHPRQFVSEPVDGLKRTALARLRPPVLDHPERVQAALAALGAEGALGCREVSRLRNCLQQRGAVALAAELQQLLNTRNFVRALGSWSLSLVPRLEHPRLEATERWPVLLDELEELCCLAEAVYGLPIS